jgi:predicted nuclease of predicted toxin-antitoxin system
LKLLLDTCVSPRTRTALAVGGHDVVWAGDWEADPGDAAILEIARRESRILITLNKDFGELAVVFDQPHSGIIRLVNIDPQDQASSCEAALAQHGRELVAGAIATVTRDRMRLRPANADAESAEPG